MNFVDAVEEVVGRIVPCVYDQMEGGFGKEGRHVPAGQAVKEADIAPDVPAAYKHQVIDVYGKRERLESPELGQLNNKS